MKTIILMITAVVMLTAASVQAQDSNAMQQACGYWLSDNAMMRLVGESKSMGMVARLGFCSAVGEKSKEMYGDISITLQNMDLGIGVSMNTSYSVLCNTSFKLIDDLSTADDVRRLINILAAPVGRYSKKSTEDTYDAVAALFTLNILAKVGGINPARIIQVEFEDPIPKQYKAGLYSNLYKALFLGKDGEALDIVRKFKDPNMAVGMFCSLQR